MILQELLNEVDVKKIIGNVDIEIEGITENSSIVSKNYMYINIEGNFEKAIKYGATVVVLDKNEEIFLDGVTCVYVDDIYKALEKIASVFYNNPHDKIKLIGIIGEKGKSTTSYMIKKIFETSNKKCEILKSKGIVAQYENLSKLGEQKYEFAIAEISQDDVNSNIFKGYLFDSMIYLNTYKKAENEYIEKICELMNNSKQVFLNADDLYALKLEKIIKSKIYKFATSNFSNIYASDVLTNPQYTEFKMKFNKTWIKIKVGMFGRFTVYNALAAISVTAINGVYPDIVLQALASISIENQNEIIPTDGTFSIISDIFKNETELEEKLISLKKYVKSRLICVVTDANSEIANILIKHCNLIVISIDNKNIEKEVIKAMTNPKCLYLVFENRKKMLKGLLEDVRKNDIILFMNGIDSETRNNIKSFIEIRQENQIGG